MAGSEELEAAAHALVFWRSTGSAVELHDRRDGGYTLQLERLCPGTRVEDAGLGAEAMLRACGDVARRLHRAGVAPRRARLTTSRTATAHGPGSGCSAASPPSRSRR